MTVRTRTPAMSSALAAVFLIASASTVGAQAQPQEAPKRHLDAEIGVGVHWALANDVPIEDDLYTGLGLAAPISDHFDGELQIAYWTARDNDDDDAADDTDENEARDGIHFNTGFRYYPGTEPDARTRFYLALGASVTTDFRDDEDATLGFTAAPGVRMRAGDRSGFLVRVPVLMQIEGGMDPMLIPTINYFYQF